MKPTYISRPVRIIDAPIPRKPNVKFVYNFFTPDERVSSTPPKLSKPVGSLTSRELSIKIPRYVRVSWPNVKFDPRRGREINESLSFLENNRSDIIDESRILSDATVLYFQDFDHLNRIGERFESSARLRGVLSGSSTDVSAKLNAVTTNSTDGRIIQRYLGLAAQSRSLFISDDKLIEPVDASAADQIAMIIDNDYVVNSSRQFSSSPVSSVAASTRANSVLMSSSNRKRKNKFALESEVELELPSIQDSISSPRAGVDPVEHIGYIVDRFEIDSDDSLKEKKLFIIPSTKVSSYLDTEIKYGIQYVYSVRSLFAFYVNTVGENGEPLKSRFLAASRPSTFSQTLTEEYIPPPPPADINFHWDYQHATLQISWAFPSDPQRNVKGWQVFRRKTVDDPFSLICQIDFDDSVIKTPSAESVDKSLIKKYKTSVTFFVEYEFNKDSDYIYAICSIDAHAMTSNYSSQYRATFNRIQNRIIKNQISQAGAPKQYPNTYLKAELSLDSVKSKNAESIKIYFDPEYLRVNNRLGRDMQVLKTDSRGGIYRFVLLNTDRQLQETLDISLKDLRELRQDSAASNQEKS
jgi:hypothetical protein